MANDTNDMLDFNEGDKPILPSSLNVLTILTFVGCAIGLLGGFWQFFTAEKSYREMVKMQDQLDQLPPMMKKMMGPDMLETSRKTMENKVPMLLLALVGVALCIYGAVEMRKLKKQGYILWVAGEFLPIIGAVFFIGAGMFSGFALFALLFPVIFLILYSVNKKHLVY